MRSRPRKDDDEAKVEVEAMAEVDAEHERKHEDGDEDDDKDENVQGGHRGRRSFTFPDSNADLEADYQPDDTSIDRHETANSQEVDEDAETDDEELGSRNRETESNLTQHVCFSLRILMLRT